MAAGTTRRSRASHPRRSAAAWTAVAVVLLAGAPLGAQQRGATIRVVAEVQSAASADLVVAEPAAPDAVTALAGRAGDGAWRVSAGGDRPVSLRLETGGTRSAAAPVAICRVTARGPTDCRTQQLPSVRLSTPGERADFLVHLRDAAPAGPAPPPVRLTVAYLAT